MRAAVLFILGAYAQQEFIAPDETQSLWRNVDGLRLGFLNDIHYEPDFDTKVKAKIASKQAKLKLVKLIQALDPEAYRAHELLFRGLFYIHRKYQIWPKRIASRMNEWKRLTRRVTRRTSAAALNKNIAIMQAIFEKPSKTKYEICDYLQKIYPKLRPVGLRQCKYRMGFIGNNVPLRLIHKVSRHMRYWAKPHAVIMNGDFVAHHHALKAQPNTFEEYKAQQQKHLNITATAFNVIRRNLGPNVPLLPSIGNNDVPVHNQMPCDQQQHDLYFKDLFDVFFPAGKHPVGFNETEAKRTFYAGGYYRYDFPDSNITLLSLNTMFFKKSNKCGKEEGKQMLVWFRQQLQENTGDRKFVLSMHVYPGLNDFEGIQNFFEKSSMDSFLEILNEGRQHVALMTGAHIHLNRQAAPRSDKYPDLHVPLFASHAVSPVYGGQPSFSVMDLSSNYNGSIKFDNVLIRSYQLNRYVLGLGDYWETLDAKVEFGIDYNNATSMVNLFERYSSPQLFGRMKGFTLGLEKLWRNLFLGEIFYPAYIQKNPEYPAQNLCPNMWYQVVEPQWGQCRAFRY